MTQLDIIEFNLKYDFYKWNSENNFANDNCGKFM